MSKLQQSMNIIDSVFDASRKAKAATPNGYATTIEINGYEFDCIVDYEIEPACRGKRNKFGEQMEPDYSAQINLGQVWIFDNQWNLIDIPEQAMTEVLAEILEYEQ